MGTETADRRPKGIKGDIAKEYLGHFNLDENKFLNRIVTWDEMWVHYAEPRTKAQSKQWKRVGFPPPKILSCLHLLTMLNSYGLILALLCQ